MSPEIHLRIFDIVGSPLFVSVEDGEKVYEKIRPLVKAGKKVVLSFDRVDIVISAFLNAAIGQLYGEFEDSKIKECISYQNMLPEDKTLLEQVIANAISYFNNKENYDQAWLEEMGDEE